MSGESPRTPPDFRDALEACRRGIEQRITPGLQLSVRWRDAAGVWHVWDHVDGRLTYDAAAPRVREDTPYDFASVTKAIVALCAVRCASRGEFALDRMLSVYLVESGGRFTGSRTVRALASHRSDLPAWKPFFQAVSAADAERGTTRERILADVVATEREDAHGEARYSDVNYILLGEALARARRASLAQIVLDEIGAPLGLGTVLHFRGVGAVDRTADIAPTEQCAWRGRIVQGNVHDENAYALGGTSGHAGLFGTATALADVGVASLRAIDGDAAWLAPDAMREMIAPLPGGSHRMGWDGKSPVGSSVGSVLGPRTFGHLGFTGTSLWCDPDAHVVVALVTNRVHPSRDNPAIKDLRVAVHDAIGNAVR